MIDCKIYYDNVKATLIASLMKVESLKKIACNKCPVDKACVNLLGNIRLHHPMKEAKQGLRSISDHILIVIEQF